MSKKFVLICSFLCLAATDAFCQKNNILGKDLPEGYTIENSYKGVIDDDQIQDYCFILKKTGSAPAEEPRPVLVVLSNHGHKKILRNDKIVWPLHYIGKYDNAFDKVSIRNNKIYLSQLFASNSDISAGILYFIFSFDKHTKTLVLNSIKRYDHDKNGKEVNEQVKIKPATFEDFDYMDYN